MKTKIILTLFVAILTHKAYSESWVPDFNIVDQVGNGGKAVLCKDDHGDMTSIQMLDFFESQRLYELFPEFPSGTPEEKALGAVNRLVAVDKERMEKYRREIQQFESNRYLTGTLSETSDAESIITPPPNCEIVQVAVQIKPSFPGDRTYYIDDTLWSKLDEDNKAGLILHEIIFHEALIRGHKNSRATRYLTALISSTKLNAMVQSDYQDTLRSLKLFTKHWTDQVNNTEWTLFDSFQANWKVATSVCKELANATLPAPQLIEINKTILLNSTLPSYLIDQQIPESWTNYRRPSDGMVGIAYWTSSNIDIFYRDINTTAEVVCVKISN